MRTVDVAIIGGGAMGSSTAHFLSMDPGFGGSVLVIERDTTYEDAATSRSNSCMRQQFTAPVNIAISKFSREYVRGFHERYDGAPQIPFDPLGYLYLATTETAAERLRTSHAIQRAADVEVDLLDADQLAERVPGMVTDDVIVACLGGPDEGYFDGAGMVVAWRQMARAKGVETVQAEVTKIEGPPSGPLTLTLSDGTRIEAGSVVNAAGTGAAELSAMMGVSLPVEPRKRMSWVFDAEDPPGKLPLTIDPSGVHVRSDGTSYMAGSKPLGADVAVARDDFNEDPDLWEDHVWPALAARVPAFERVRVRARWGGHYDYNMLDHNALIGPLPGAEAMILVNGFSGHGLQQSPAMGRGVAELITTGRTHSLDLSPLTVERVFNGTPIIEQNVI